MKITGYDHTNRGVGIRNLQLILPSVVCSTRVSSRIATQISKQYPAITFAHQHGCGIIGNDVGGITEYFASLAKHPNIGSVLIVGLGCETIQGNELADKLLKENSSTKYLVIQESGGVQGTVDGGVSAAKELNVTYPPKKAELRDLHIGIDLSNANLVAAELVTQLGALGIKTTVSSSHKNSGLNFSELMEAGVHLIVSFPDENQPASGFPLIPTLNISSNSPVHMALAADFDLAGNATVAQIIELIESVGNGAKTKVEAMGAGEIIAPRVVRSV